MSFKMWGRVDMPKKDLTLAQKKRADIDALKLLMSKNSTSRYNLVMTLDSEHDFCENRTKEFIDNMGTDKILSYLLSKKGGANPSLLTQYKTICCTDDDKPKKNEHFVENITRARSLDIGDIKRDNLDDCKTKINTIINYFRYGFKLHTPSTPVSINKEDNIYIFCDGGPNVFNSLVEYCVTPSTAKTNGRSAAAIAALEKWRSQFHTNLIHTLTPATACDSATTHTSSAFFNATIFMRPSNIPESLSSLFDTKIKSDSEPFVLNGPTDFGRLHIEVPGPITYKHPNAIIMSKSVTSVTTLAKSMIATYRLDDEPNTTGYALNHNDFKEKEIKPKPLDNDADIDAHIDNFLTDTKGTKIDPSFHYSTAFDIKRAGDSDQAYQAYLIVQEKRAEARKSGNFIPFKYIFLTSDQICANIASHFYGLNTIFQRTSYEYALWDEQIPTYQPLLDKHGYIDKDFNVQYPLNASSSSASASSSSGGARKKSIQHVFIQKGGRAITRSQALLLQKLKAPNEYNQQLEEKISEHIVHDINHESDTQVSAYEKMYTEEELEEETQIKDRIIIMQSVVLSSEKIYKNIFLSIVSRCASQLRNLIFQENPQLIILASYSNIKNNGPNIRDILRENHNNLYSCAKIDENLEMVGMTTDELDVKKRNNINVTENMINEIKQDILEEFGFNNIEIHIKHGIVAALWKLLDEGLWYGRDGHPLNPLVRLCLIGLFGELLLNPYEMESSIIFRYFFNDIHDKNSLKFKKEIEDILNADKFTQSEDIQITSLFSTLYALIIKNEQITNSKVPFKPIVLRRGGRRTLKRRRRNNRKTRKSRK